MAKRSQERRGGARRFDEDEDELFPSDDDDEEERDDDRRDDDDDEEKPRARRRRSDDGDEDDELKIDDVYEPPRPRAPVGIVGGALSVLATAVIALILFTLIGFVIVLGGRIAGIIEPAIAREGGSGFASAVAAASEGASAQAQTPPTVDPRCDLAGAWWESVRGQVEALAGLFGNVHIIPADQRALNLSAAAAARDAIEASAASPCLARAKQSLASAAREAVNVYTQVAAGNLSTFSGGRGTVELALAEMYMALWSDAGYATAPNSPPALGVIRLGGADCTAQTQRWYDQLKPSLDSLNNLIATDPNLIVGAQLRRVIGDIRAIGETVRQSSPPECAAAARDLLVESIEAYASGFENFGAADIQSSRGGFQRGAMSEFAFTAWMNWLGVLAL
jgi:hypothetical protein